uniref:Uncharacterized protein n=1 Tax=Timema genevievae TaxID=629358 RepID=A0A7R9JRV2_TIMGE|nr:unnamed protein product [Timema genevievae]
MGLVHYVHFVLLFLVNVAKCDHKYECSDWLPQFDKPDEPDCYMPKEGNDKLLTLAPGSPYPVSWVVNNSDLGEIDVEFAIMSNYTDYIISLAVSNVSEHTCAGPHLFKKHSTRNYIIAHFNDSENDNFLCERTGHLIFQYVYTGCYRIEIEASSPNRFEGSYKSFTRFIKTNYVKIGLTKSPIFNHNFYNSMKNHPQFNPTKIRTSISPFSVVWLNTTGAFANYATEADLNESLPSYDLTELFSENSHNIILSVMLSILVLALVLVVICYFKTMAYPNQVSRQRRDDSLRKPSFIPLVGGVRPGAPRNQIKDETYRDKKGMGEFQMGNCPIPFQFSVVPYCSTLAPFLCTCTTDRANHPLYCLGHSTLHALRAVRDKFPTILNAHENSSFYWLAWWPLSLTFSHANGKLPFLPLDKVTQKWRVYNAVISGAGHSESGHQTLVCQYLKELINCLMLRRSNIVLTFSLPTITLPPTVTYVAGTSTLPPHLGTSSCSTTTHVAGKSSCSTATNIARTCSPTFFLPLPTRV